MSKLGFSIEWGFALGVEENGWEIERGFGSEGFEMEIRFSLMAKIFGGNFKYKY